MSPLPALLSHLRKGPAGLRLGLSAAFGLILGLALVPRQPQPEDPHAPPPQLIFLGQTLPSDDSAAERALALLRARVAGKLSLQLDGDAREVSYADLGVAIDTVRLQQLIQDSRDATSPLRRTRRRLAQTGPIALPATLVFDEQRTLATLQRFKDELDRPALPARIDIEQHKVVAEQVGRTLDADASLGAISRALEVGATSVTAVFQKLKPQRVAAGLSQVRYDSTIAYFETPYDRSERSQARTFNLRHAAEKLDGLVLFPGQEFDFNATVGPRDEAHGYQVAKVIAEGELVDGIGGGTCQISGTLHAAVFFAGLDILERYPHTRPSSYMKMGLDAAVAYPTMNFRFRNSSSLPIVIHETVTGGVVRAEIRGAQVGPAVTLIRRIESSTNYDELERADNRVPFGKRVLLQRGVPGFKLKRYRVVRDEQYGVRDMWRDTYPPTSQIVLVGQKHDSKPTDMPHSDIHPEYLADELLVLTKQRETPDEPTRFSERRDPGRFGEKGWTKAAGMPFFESKP
ncbi:MAG TPA: VanW family protein [Polyangiaceae bacterium]|nr:VanW family protein [Polyangiaceae bacterium]